MAIGFRTSGMFGRRPWDTPGFGDGVNERMQEMAAPMGTPNPSAMPIGVQQMTKKPKFFSKDGLAPVVLAGISDFFARQNGDDQNMLGDMVAAKQQMAMQEEDARIRAQLAQQQRMQKREDFIFEKQYEAANPKPKQPTALEQNFAWFNSLPPEQKAAFLKYQDAVNPLGSIGPDGRFYARPRADDAVVSMPVTDDEWNNASPMGGSGGNVTGGFR